MSFFAIFNAITDDLLDTLKLKPWWEKWREYAFKTSLAVIALFTFTTEMNFDCVRFFGDGYNSEQILTKPQAKAVNSYCKIHTLPWYICHAHLIAFVSSILTYVLANYWIFLSGVKEKLIEISTFGCNIIKLNMNLKEMRYWSSIPVTSLSKHEHHVLRDNVRTLQKYHGQSNLSKQYTIRCAVVLLWTGFCSVTSLALYMEDDREVFLVRECEIKNNILQLGEEGSPNMFKCVNVSSHITPLLEAIIGVTFTLQCISMIIPLCMKCISEDKSDIPTFMILMMAIPEDEAKQIRSFVKFVTSRSGFNEKLISNIDKAIIAGDTEFLRLLYKSMEDKGIMWNIIESVATRVLREGENNALSSPNERQDIQTLNHDDPSQSRMINSSSLYQTKLNDADLDVYYFLSAMERADGQRSISTYRIRSFERRLFDRRNWHLLYCTPLVHREPSFLSGIKLDLLDKEGRSYLYYALRKSSLDKKIQRFSHFNKFMKEIDSTHEALVHFDGISMHAEEFFYSEYQDIFRGELPNFRLRKNQHKSQFRSHCDDEYDVISQNYLADISDYEAIQEMTTASRLNTIKLRKLTIPNAMVEKALINRHWEVIVALLNTYIIVYKQRQRPESHLLIRHDIFKLQRLDDLTELFKESLKRPRDRPYFVSTAAEHLLSIMTASQRRRMITHIDEAPLSTNIRQYLKEMPTEIQTGI